MPLNLYSRHAPSVEARFILPPFAPRHEIEREQRFLMATELHAPLPRFPGGVAPRHSPVTVCVELVVEADGRVSKAGVLDGEAACTPNATGAVPFVDATLKAVSRWTFFAAALCRPPTGTGDCDDPSATVEPVASRMAYRFDFEDGRARVSPATSR